MASRCACTSCLGQTASGAGLQTSVAVAHGSVSGVHGPAGEVASEDDLEAKMEREYAAAIGKERQYVSEEQVGARHAGRPAHVAPRLPSRACARGTRGGQPFDRKPGTPSCPPTPHIPHPTVRSAWRSATLPRRWCAH